VPDSAPPNRKKGLSEDDWTFLRKLLIAVVVVALVYFVWLASGILLLVFAAILFAVLFRWLAELLVRAFGIPYGLGLTLVVALFGALLIGLVVLFGSQIRGQLADLANKLPIAIDAVGDRLGIGGASTQLEGALKSGSTPSVLSRAAGIGYTILGILADAIVVLIASIYIAADPHLYRRGATKLLPPEQHGRVLEAMDATARALRLWFSGQLVSMALVGTVSGLAYWWIGLPNPLALGAVAAVTNFVPYLGPILGAIPALVFAFAMDTNAVMWTLGIVVAIQQIEGNIIAPMIQRHVVAVPPAVVLFSIVLFGSIFGLLGVFLAVPMTVASIVLLNKFWIRQALGAPESTLGDPGPTLQR
jgi:predicted PurR-regulated permease PerM